MEWVIPNNNANTRNYSVKSILTIQGILNTMIIFWKIHLAPKRGQPMWSLLHNIIYCQSQNIKYSQVAHEISISYLYAIIVDMIYNDKVDPNKTRRNS